MRQLLVLNQTHTQQISTRELLNDIINNEHVHTVFQPIVDLNRRTIHGYEALIRGPERYRRFFSPLPLFEAAQTPTKLEVQMEIMCRKVSIRQYAELGLREKLFLNISPNALMNPDFETGKTLPVPTKEYNITPEQVVIEVTEQQKTHNYRCRRCHHPLSRYGFYGCS